MSVCDRSSSSSSRDCDTHCVDLVEDLPLLVGYAEALRGLDGPLHLTGPHLQVADILRLDELAQLLGKLNGGETFRLFKQTRESRVEDKSREATSLHPTYLFASGREARVPPDAALDVELALAVATQVDGARRDVDVHEVVHDPALDVVQHPVDHVSLTNIHNFDVGKIPSSVNSNTKYNKVLEEICFCVFLILCM